jgi:hypothetical protein
MKNSKAILQVPGTMKIISAEIPVPKEDEVLIKVEYVGICGSDVHGFESGPQIPTYSTLIKTSSSLGTGISAEIIFIVPGTCNIAFEFFILNPPVLFIGYCINT